MAAGTCEPFFKIPQKTIYKIIDNTCITSMHIAAFLVLCCFTNKEGTFTRASKESLITYAKIPRKKACQVLDDLHSFEFAVREDTVEHGRGFKISQGLADNPVFFPVDLVKSKSIPSAKIARLHNNAAKVLLWAYLSHEQQVTLCCDMSEFPFERYDCAKIASVPDYTLLAAVRPSLMVSYVPSGINKGDLLCSLKDLVDKKLLNRCVAVIEAIESFPTVIYHLTPPYTEIDKGQRSIGTRMKLFCRNAGHSIKEGNWVAFAQEDVEASVVAVYSPVISFHWSDFAQGIQEYKARQFEAERAWSSIQEQLSNEAWKKLNMA